MVATGERRMGTFWFRQVVDIPMVNSLEHLDATVLSSPQLVSHSWAPIIFTSLVRVNR